MTSDLNAVRCTGLQNEIDSFVIIHIPDAVGKVVVPLQQLPGFVAQARAVNAIEHIFRRSPRVVDRELV